VDRSRTDDEVEVAFDRVAPSWPADVGFDDFDVRRQRSPGDLEVNGIPVDRRHVGLGKAVENAPRQRSVSATEVEDSLSPVAELRLGVVQH
jgi:hypothetical protein